MAEESRMALKNKKKKLKEKLTPPIILLILLIAVIAVYSIKPISEYIGNIIDRDSARHLAEQLYSYKLPEKTERVEGIYYAYDGEKMILLFIRSDLSLAQISDYYRGFHVASEKGESEGTVNVSEQEQSAEFCAEDLARSFGGIQKFSTDSSYKNQYTLCINE